MSCCLSPTPSETYVALKIEEKQLNEGVLKLIKVLKPDWHSENIILKLFTDGITNKLVACQLGNDSNNIILVRIYGNKTDLLIDRKAEVRNIKALNVLGLAPKIYGIFENGLAYQYYPGVTLNVSSVLDPVIWPLVAKQMAKMHKVELGKEINKEPMLWAKIEQFLTLLPEPFTHQSKQERFANSFGTITRLRIEFERLKSHLNNIESPIVFAHNDLLLGNVIYNADEKKVSFIDYEYAAYNYQAFDIANHFNEYVGVSLDINYNMYPKEEFQKSWIEVYLAEFLNIDKPTVTDIEKVYAEVQLLSLASDFLWGIWSLVQYELSNIDFDFGRYAEIRLNRYFEQKLKLLK